MAQELGFIPEDPGYTNPFRIQATPTPVRPHLFFQSLTLQVCLWEQVKAIE